MDVFIHDGRRLRKYSIIDGESFPEILTNTEKLLQEELDTNSWV